MSSTTIERLRWLNTVSDTKSEKAPGIDSLQAELLKADIGTTSRLLTDLFCKIWEQEVIPKDWFKGLIFKLPKKGDLGNCDNWRGISLLSVPKQDILQNTTKAH